MLAFDYFDYRNHTDLDTTGLLNSEFFKGKKNVYVFVTHSHRDHFDPTIFNWENQNPNIQYILSDDVTVDSSNNNLYFMKKYEQIHIDDLEIRTYGTTGLGLSFLVKIDPIGIYHAGDLNWWHWKNDSPETQTKEEKDLRIKNRRYLNFNTYPVSIIESVYHYLIIVTVFSFL